MEDLKKKAKLSVLEDLISMMKEKETEDFKGKSSKFFPKEEMSIEIEAEPKEEEPSIDESENEESDDEDIERLKEMYSRLK